jgi:RimJ/RimL family protein N-acetyltransferase
VTLREVRARDLPIFFAQQLDPAVNWMVGFASRNPTDRAAFDAHWARIMADPTITLRTILEGDRVAGNIVSFPADGALDVGYWLGREFWGRGIATHALRQFLAIVTRRPLYAHVVFDNHASRRVLEKCGFRLTGAGHAFSEARGDLVEELKFILTE